MGLFSFLLYTENLKYLMNNLLKWMPPDRNFTFFC